MTRHLRARQIRFFSGLGALFISLQLSLGQGTFVILNTGGGPPLVSEARQVQVDASLANPTLHFDFGFATDESFLPGAFLDSFTVSIQDTNRGLSTFYLTADASGIVWAPVTPGAIPIDLSSISATPISYPSLQPVLAGQRAFRVSAPVPAQFSGETVDVFFDLADNLDATPSQGWFSDLSVTEVPEPQAWALLAVALLSRWSFTRLRS